MCAAAAFDNSTLSWVKDEIDLALERAAEALARHVAAPAETSLLAEARSHLHQACGALTIVGLSGVSHLAETVEAQLAGLESAAETHALAVAAAAGAALEALRRYLDDLMAGHPDQPLRLYPPYRALILAAGLPVPAPLALFYPDLTQRPPHHEGPVAPLTPVRAKAIRLGFARGLAKWRGGEPRGMTEMRNALTSADLASVEPAERALWWVARAWIETSLESARDGALLDALDAQFEALAQGRQAAASVPESLLAGLLYGIAVAPAGSDLLESVRAAYRLADLIPATQETVETHRTACRAPLATAMAEWEKFSQGSAIALVRFHDVALLLAASARDSHDPELARLADAVAEFAVWLRQQPERTDAGLTLELAGALVLIKDGIEQEGVRSPGETALFAAEVTDTLAGLKRIQEGLQAGTTGQAPRTPRRWREQQIRAQVAGEIRNNLIACEPALDAYFDAPAETAALPDVQARLHQITGAFDLLDETAAAQLGADIEQRLEHCRQVTSGAADFASLAERLAALGEFAASLQRHQPNPGLLAAFQATALPSPQAEPVAPEEPATHVPMKSMAAESQDAEMRVIFIEEAQAVLAELATARPRLVAMPDDRGALASVRRGYHTLKGSGRMVGLTDLGEVAFAVEKQLNRWLDEHRPATPELLEMLDIARELFARWVTALEQDGPSPDPAALLERCGVCSTSPAVPPTPTFVPAPETVTVGDVRLTRTLFQLYVDEARTHVATLRSELAQFQGVPSRDLIRATHTLAGISAGTGFPHVQAVARALENVLVRHSLAHAIPEEAGRMLIARAVGALEGMVGAIAEQRPPADESSLAAALDALETARSVLPAATATQISPLAERRQSRPADEIDPQLAGLFLEEADEQLRSLDADLRAWRAAPERVDTGRRMARLLHTFKGGARMCGAMGIGELAHSMETRIEQALASGGPALPEVLDSLDTSLGRANQLVSALHQPAPAPASSTAATTAQPAAAAAPATAVENAPAVLLRVRADLIDRMVGEAGEMATARSRIEGSLKTAKGALLDLTENIARLRGQLREFEIIAETSMQSRLGGSESQQFDPLELDRFTRLQELTRMMTESVGDVATVQHALLRQVDTANTSLAAQSRLNRDLSHSLLRARMVPFSTVAERLHRIVRQTAKELNKQANLDIQGGDTPLDRTVLERMLAPLEHLLRNAVAHGIEPPVLRTTAGKAELGQIVLTIVPGDNDVVLTLADDGRGIDLAAIRQRALERRLLEPGATPDDAALVELIFRPGFSTASQVNEIAGRGVGLDVVRSEVDHLGGHITVDGAAGQGTRFKIVLPLTLAVIPVMLVRAAARTWAIPAALVEEAHELAPDEEAARRAAGALQRNGLRYPWHSLAGLYGLPQDSGSNPWQMLLKSGGAQIALEVEAVAQNQEVVVKPLGEMLANVPGLTGATVLADGSVALIVNPVTLAGRASQDLTASPPARAETSHGAPASVTPIIPVLIVDDSLTVRKVTGRLLERAGYRVLLAKDGLEALDRIAEELPAVILADIEMPRMDGFELVRALHEDPRRAAVPVIMISSRSADRHRQVALDLGVRHYLGKPFDEAVLLELIATLVQPAGNNPHA